jgi:hypothetical protein
MPLARSAEALDAGLVASGAKITPGEPGEALHREQLDAGDVPPPLDVPLPPGGLSFTGELW